MLIFTSYCVGKERCKQLPTKCDMKACIPFCLELGLACCRCWPPMLAGRDVQAVAEPGSGKTFGYLLPAVKFLHNQAADARRRVLILLPTRWA